MMLIHLPGFPKPQQRTLKTQNGRSSLLVALIVFGLIVSRTNSLKFNQRSEEPEPISRKDSPPVDNGESEARSSEPAPKRTGGRHSRRRPTLKANEIREESKNSLVNCGNVTVREEFGDCVINNLSLEFFFTAFVFYKKRFRKNYGSVHEENRRFQIFMRNYQKILK